MTEPYPQDVRAFAGEDLDRGTPAPGAPNDPEVTARAGGAGTGLVVAAPADPDTRTRQDIAGGRSDGDAERPGEVLEGFVVDLACLRRYPHDQYTERASGHTTDCALMGHCVESGYGIVDDDNRLVPLDTRATPHLVAALQVAPDTGARVRVERADVEGEMHTTKARLL